MTKSLRDVGCLVLFALPFAGAGLVVMFLGFRMVWGWYEASSWVETPARIISTDLEVNTDSDSDDLQGSGQLRVHLGRNRPMSADRVSLSPGADNIGSFHQDKQAELARYRESGELFRCFVDPDEPSRSILYRDMRLGMFSFLMLFGGIFAGVGFGFIGAGLWSERQDQEEGTARKPASGRPLAVEARVGGRAHPRLGPCRIRHARDHGAVLEPGVPAPAFHPARGDLRERESSSPCSVSSFL